MDFPPAAETGGVVFSFSLSLLDEFSSVIFIAFS